MSKDNLVRLADILNDALVWSPIDMLHEAKQNAINDYKDIKKAIVIFYDEDNIDNCKRIRWIQAGMKRSEILNVLSLARDDLILSMFNEIEEGL